LLLITAVVKSNVAPRRRPTSQRLADVPHEIEWFANLGNKSTRRAYEHTLQDFMRYSGIVQPEEFRSITRA
jgi:hypothetical protein